LPFPAVFQSRGGRCCFTVVCVVTWLAVTSYLRLTAQVRSKQVVVLEIHCNHAHYADSLEVVLITASVGLPDFQVHWSDARLVLPATIGRWPGGFSGLALWSSAL